jgi:Asp-tRNA(Asn)/Glu-tRNA(Gln) amidotransferase A subunit family amidase
VSKKWYNYFVETNPSGADSSAQPAGPSPRVTDLVADAGAETTFAEPVAAPGEQADLNAVYRSAQIPTPPHGYTVLKVAEMLHSEHIRALPDEVKKKSIMVALDAAGVKVADIVEDAVHRDRALDTYERVLIKNLETTRAGKERENAQLESEINERIAELRKRIADNRAEIDREQSEVEAWRARKREEENRIADAVGHFVSPNPITATGTQRE